MTLRSLHTRRDCCPSFRRSRLRPARHLAFVTVRTVDTQTRQPPFAWLCGRRHEFQRPRIQRGSLITIRRLTGFSGNADGFSRAISQGRAQQQGQEWHAAP